MKVGKLTVLDLEELVFKNLKSSRKEVISSPEIGGDCAIIDFGDKVAYLSTDPITGTSKGIGKLAININCNDIAAGGVEPVGVMLTILLPPGTTKNEVTEIMREAEEECKKLNVTIMGGHTEVTTAVNRVVISATAIGIGEKKSCKDKEKVICGDRIIITKGIGIEGTGIIAYEKESELQDVIGESLLREAKDLLDKTSVVKDGLLAAKHVKGMHDVTEGGLLGAIWEITEFYKLGTKICYENILIPISTKKICEYYKIDPLKLISSGTMLMIVSEEKVEELITVLKKEGIDAFDIGFLTKTKEKILSKNKIEYEILEPESDELYKVV